MIQLLGRVFGQDTSTAERGTSAAEAGNAAERIAKAIAALINVFMVSTRAAGRGFRASLAASVLPPIGPVKALAKGLLSGPLSCEHSHTGFLMG